MMKFEEIERKYAFNIVNRWLGTKVRKTSRRGGGSGGWMSPEQAFGTGR